MQTKKINIEFIMLNSLIIKFKTFIRSFTSNIEYG